MISPIDSDLTPLENRIMIDPTDFARVEKKVDKLTEALTRLVLFEERQSSQAVRLSNIETDAGVNRKAIELVDKKVDQWINRGWGIWAFAISLFSLYQLFSPHK